MKLVSIIVPIYNVEKYIVRCVKSIMYQTYKNIEIILVDDGSKDKCPEICDELKNKDSRIKVIHKTNGGLSDARNCGLDIAKGEYICFVDSDDWIELDMIESMIENIYENDSDICVCGVCKVYSKKSEYIDFSDLNDVYSKKEIMKELAFNENMPSWAWNKLYKREIINSIRFPKGKLYEDIYVMHEIFNNAQKISILKKCKYYYLQREDSIIGTTSLNSIIEHYDAFKTRYFYIKENYPQYLKYSQCMMRIAVMRIFEVAGKDKACGRKVSLRDLRKYKKCLKELNIPKDNSILPYNRRLIKQRMKMFSISPLLLMYVTEVFFLIKNKMLKNFNKEFLNILKIKLGREKLHIKRSDSRRIFLIGTPEYNNLGDHAIAYAELEFLKGISKFETVEITENQFICNVSKLKAIIKDTDILALQGGGNMGNQYFMQNSIRYKILKKFKKNKIVIFPQTIYYSESDQGKNQKEYDKKILSKHKNLFIVAREEKSYYIMKENFKENNILMAPDIVLSLKYEADEKVKREGAVICLRNDVESVFSAEQIIEIKNKVYKVFKKVIVTDTCTGYSINSKDRKSELNKKWREFSSAEVIITDRLHGVIFSAITSTPCIIIRNYNHKLKGIYNWLKSFKFIRFCDNLDNMDLLINQILKEKDYVYNPHVYEKEFSLIRNLFY